jgi:uncharacterized protein YceK
MQKLILSLVMLILFAGCASKVGKRAGDVAGAVLRAPGNVATVEIKTGKRRVISFLLSPIAKAVREAGRER